MNPTAELAFIVYSKHTEGHLDDERVLRGYFGGANCKFS